GETGSDGSVRFAGLSPNSGYSATARIVGRKISRSTDISIPETGISTVTAELPDADLERFFIGGHIHAEDNAIELVGIDVAAELPVTERVELESWARSNQDLADSDSGGTLFFSTRETLAGVFGSRTGDSDESPKDLALAISALQVAQPVGTTSLIYQPAEGRYLGRHPTTGGLIVSMNDGSQVGLSHVDPISGIQTWAVFVGGQYSGPFLSPDSKKAVLFGLRIRSMVEIDLTDTSVTRAYLPEIDSPIAVGVDNLGRWLAFSIPTGDLYRIDPDMSASLVATLPELKGQFVTLEPDPTSPRLLFLSPDDSLAYVVDGESGTTSTIIPTEGEIDEALFSRDGSRVFLASRETRAVYVYTWPELRRLDSVSLPERSPAR
ncbi:MAG: hypothetical protein QF609_00575, partial [Gammaproteobacteria bacterium]|nr:hypothetical protein [Gammaproteobacteria bacterium]